MATVTESYRRVKGDQGSLRIGFTVLDCLGENDAIQKTIESAPTFLPVKVGDYPNGGLPGNRPKQTDRERNKWLWRWKVAVEEIKLLDVARGSAAGIANAAYHTFVDYRHRAVCPIPTYDWGTQSQTVYEGVAPPVIHPRDEATDGKDTATRGIGEERNGSQFSVKGTSKLHPSGRINIIWQPMEFDVSGLLVDKNYMREALSYVGTTNEYNFLDTWEPGEILMTSFSGRQIDQYLDTWEFNYGFQALVNKKDVTIDGITVDIIPAFSHIWGPRRIVPTTATGGTAPKQSLTSKYVQLNVEQIYYRSDFGTLFLDQYGDNLVKNCPYFERMNNIPTNGGPDRVEYALDTGDDPDYYTP